MNWFDHPLGSLLWLALGATSVWLHFWLEPLRWKKSYLSAGFAEADKIKDVMYATALASYLLPFKLGLPFRAYFLGRFTKLGHSLAISLLALEGLITISTWLAIASICAAFLATDFFDRRYVMAIIALIAAVVASIAFLRTKKPGIFSTEHMRAVGSLDALPKRVATAVCILTVDVLSYGARHAFLIAFVTGSATGSLAFAAAGILSTFTGIISGLPLGLIGYDASLIALLTAKGIALSQATLVVALNRAFNLAIAALLGIPASIRLGLGNRLSSIVKSLREFKRE